MRAGRFQKTPEEVKQYTIDYTDWLAEDETVSSIEFDITPVSATSPLTVDSSAIDADGKLVSFYVSGGEDDEQYKLVATATTSTGQVKEDLVRFSIQEI